MIKAEFQVLNWVHGEPKSVLYKTYEFGKKDNKTNEIRFYVTTDKNKFSFLINGEGTISYSMDHD